MHEMSNAMTDLCAHNFDMSHIEFWAIYFSIEMSNVILKVVTLFKARRHNTMGYNDPSMA